MSHDQDKKCLDDSIIVDTLSAVSRGLHASAASHGTMNDYQQHWRAFIFSLSSS